MILHFDQIVLLASLPFLSLVVFLIEIIAKKVKRWHYRHGSHFSLLVN